MFIFDVFLRYISRMTQEEFTHIANEIRRRSVSVAQGFGYGLEDAEDIAQEDTAQDIKDEIIGIGEDVEEILNIQRSIRYYSELPAQGTDGYVYITPDGIFYYDGTEDEYQQISGNDSLNGFSFAKNNSNQVVMTYTNPEDETDTAEAVMPTNTTLQAVLTEMQGITADLMLIAGGNT